MPSGRARFNANALRTIPTWTMREGVGTPILSETDSRAGMTSAPHQLYALVSNDFSLHSALLLPHAEQMRAGPADGATAWGFGSVQDRRALVKRRPRLGNHVFDFAKLVEDAPSRTVFGVTVGATGRPLPTDAIPPFRFHNWLIAGYPGAMARMSPDVRNVVRSLIPTHVLRTLEGDSDEELLAHAMLGEIAMDPASKNADFPAERLRQHTLAASDRIQAALTDAGAPTPPLDTLIGNGRAFVAVARTRPLFWQHAVGLADDPVEAARRRDMHLSARQTPRPHFRGLVITSVPGDEDWERLEPGHVLTYTTASGARVDTVEAP